MRSQKTFNHFGKSTERRTEVDGVDLALDLDDRILAAVDGDDLLEVDVLENNVVVVLLVLLKPSFKLNRQWFAKRQQDRKGNAR